MIDPDQTCNEIAQGMRVAAEQVAARERELIVAMLLSDFADCLRSGITWDFGQGIFDVPLKLISDALDKRAELREREPEPDYS